jgi:alkylation response protein AidB-like acyl-CoA dehydrogenase
MLTTPAADEDSREIHSIVRRFLADRLPLARTRELAASASGYDLGSWSEMAQMGWLALGLPEGLGGAGFGPVQQCALFEEFGRAVAGTPLLACAGFVLPVLTSCEGPSSEALARRIGRGETVAALVDAPGGAGVSAVRGPDGPMLNGPGGLVLDGQNASVLVVVADLDGAPSVLAAEPTAAGVTISSVEVVDRTRRFAEVAFDSAPAQVIATPSLARLASASDITAVLLAAEQIGGAMGALDLTFRYLCAREQFGRPIGSFQALKHRCADIAVTVSLARELVYGAAAAYEAEAWSDLALAARAALLRSVEAYHAAAAECIQLHGAIGFTDECDIGIYYRRALVTRDLRGTTVELRDQLAVQLGV